MDYKEEYILLNIREIDGALVITGTEEDDVDTLVLKKDENDNINAELYENWVWVKG